MAVAMRRTGLLGEMTVVANFGDVRMRARLAKGTLNALGAHDVPVGCGTDGFDNRTFHQQQQPSSTEHFDACEYLAPESELDERSGVCNRVGPSRPLSLALANPARREGIALCPPPWPQGRISPSTRCATPGRAAEGWRSSAAASRTQCPPTPCTPSPRALLIVCTVGGLLRHRSAARRSPTWRRCCGTRGGRSSRPASSRTSS